MSTVVDRSRVYTPEDLLAMPDDRRYELVDGRLVELNASGLSSIVEANVIFRLASHCRENNLGFVMPSSNMYGCFRWKPGLIRRPDASVIRHGRATDEELSEGITRVAPDLAVEVVSPNDLAYELEKKLGEYLRAGVRLVWIVVPESRTVRVHRADGTVSWLREQDDLTGEDVLPGFQCRVSRLFPEATAAGSAAATGPVPGAPAT